MSKNILIITGSPRKGGNTDLVAEAFADGAKGKGHKVTIFNTGAKTVNGCKACDTCWSTGRACTFKDGFTELEPLLEQADTVVFASPVYWFGFSAQIKAAVDKLYAYVSPSTIRPLKAKESLMLACAGDTNMAVFEPLVQAYEATLEHLNWKNAGILRVPGVYQKGDVNGTEYLDQARQMGTSL